MKPTFEERQAVRDEMLAMTETLVAEFGGRVPAANVMRCVARCRDVLLSSGVRDGLVTATEAAARMRLRSTLPARA